MPAVVKRNHEIRPGKLFIKAVAHNGPRAVDHLFSGLAEYYERSMPLGFKLRQEFRGAEHVRDVDIVTAGMHNADLLPRIVQHFHFARIRQPGFFGDRESVELGAQKHRWAVAVSQYRHDAVAG